MKVIVDAKKNVPGGSVAFIYTGDFPGSKSMNAVLVNIYTFDQKFLEVIGPLATGSMITINIPGFIDPM
jgi:hypothetical protein